MASHVDVLRIASGDGTPLHGEVTTHASEPRFAVALVHGFGEHIGRYRHVAAWLRDHGVGMLAADLRGHGHSAGRRSFIVDYDDYLADVGAIVVEARRRFAGLPLFLTGHSMGGLIAALYAAQHGEPLAGAILSSPAFGFAVEVSAVKKAIGHAMSRIWPTLALPAGVPSNKLTHVHQIVEAYDADPLVNKHATARWYTSSLEAQAKALDTAGHLRVPLLVMCAGSDEVASTPAAKMWFDRAGSRDKTYRELPGMYHEIFNEVDREDVFQQWLGWMETRAEQRDATESDAGRSGPAGSPRA